MDTNTNTITNHSLILPSPINNVPCEAYEQAWNIACDSASTNTTNPSIDTLPTIYRWSNSTTWEQLFVRSSQSSSPPTITPTPSPQPGTEHNTSHYTGYQSRMDEIVAIAGSAFGLLTTGLLACFLRRRRRIRRLHNRSQVTPRPKALLTAIQMNNPIHNTTS